MKTKHTPGPWETNGMGVFSEVIEINKKMGSVRYSKTGRQICELDSLSCDYEGDDGETLEELMEANAKLIAAAPDLLEAAIALDEATDSTMGFTTKQLRAWGALMDAITKAVGEE